MISKKHVWTTLHLQNIRESLPKYINCIPPNPWRHVCTDWFCLPTILANAPHSQDSYQHLTKTERKGFRGNGKCFHHRGALILEILCWSEKKVKNITHFRNLPVASKGTYQLIRADLKNQRKPCFLAQEFSQKIWQTAVYGSQNFLKIVEFSVFREWQMAPKNLANRFRNLPSW